MCFNSLLDLPVFLGAVGEKEALPVQGVSLLASAGLGGRGGDSRRGCGGEPPRTSERERVEEETDRHPQAHQEGPGAKSPTTKKNWTKDHVQFSFAWPLSTLPGKS